MSAPRPSRITPNDIRIIAFTLVDQHGAQALGVADHIVYELEGKGEARNADAWRALRWEIQDALDGRIERETPIQLH